MKNKNILASVFFLAFALSPVQGFAAEPAYCTYENFKRHEVAYDRSGIKNEHVFRFAGFNLMGLAVGESKFRSVVTASSELGVQVTRNENYCTWYFNDGNDDAMKNFNWHYVDRPDWNIPASVNQYKTVLKGIFADNAVNMLNCAARNKYVAMGCDGQKHRGPTVFGMLLAYSGCSPANAAQIVNTIWGLNTVPAESRLAVITEAYKMGSANPRARAAFQQLFGVR